MTASVVPVVIKINRVDPRARVPIRASSGSAGFDLFALTDVVVRKRDRALIPLGIKMEIPMGMYGRIAPRSGHAVNNGIHVGAGVIDSDYRGEVAVLLFNLSSEDFYLSQSCSVAQLILEDIRPVVWVQTLSLSETARNGGGFGSTDHEEWSV